MADKVIDTPAEAVTTEAAPVVEVTPEVIDTTTPEVAQEVTPAVEAVEEAPAVEETHTEAKKAETLLGEDTEKSETESEAKPEEVEAEEKTEETQDKSEEESKTEEGQSEEPAPPPVYEDFKAPEGFTLDTEQVKEFTNLLSELELEGKADHAAIQAFGQKAVDFYVAQQAKAAEDMAKFYQTTWEKQKTDWKEAFLSDPEIGGKRFQTTVDSANTFIRTHGGSEEQQTEFRSLMESSGLGNHPAMIRILANAGRAMSEGVPLAAQNPPPQSKSKTATLYGK